MSKVTVHKNRRRSRADRWVLPLLVLGLNLGSLPHVSWAQPPVPTLVPAATPSLTPSVTPSATPPASPFAMATATPTAAPAIPKAPAINMSAEAYRARLQAQLRALQGLSKKSPRPVGAILKQLQTVIKVKRSDGDTQEVSGSEFMFHAGRIVNQGNATKSEIATLEKVLKGHIAALDEWLATPLYKSVDGKKIVAQLEKDGEIQTGPPWWQQKLASGWRAIGDAWAALMRWIGSLMPTPPAPKAMPNVNLSWLWSLFYIAVAALLIAIIFLVWRAFGGNWGRQTARRQAILEHEDAELLLLPPEELRSRADVYADQGNFREALRHRYLALLIQMDSRGVWRYDSRRTNWEHISALRRRDANSTLVTPLSALTQRFDRVRYGGAPCDPEMWRQFDADAREFEAQMGSQQLTGASR